VRDGLRDPVVIVLSLVIMAIFVALISVILAA
jgi:hypothetical protein